MFEVKKMSLSKPRHWPFLPGTFGVMLENPSEDAIWKYKNKNCKWRSYD